MFLKHAERHYRKNGALTSEFDNALAAIRPLKELYGATAVDGFGPLALKAVREEMVARGWCRNTINRAVARVRHIFRFALENELLADASVVQKLEAITPLLAGRTDAHDNEPREAVPLDRIDAVKQHVSERCRDLIELQLLVGARPGELLALTGGMIDRSGEVWTATLAAHKTQHKGKSRKLMFGSKAQLILRKYLAADPDARLFPMRVDSYQHAVSRACKKLKVAPFTPAWLRHNAETRVRDEFSLEHAQAVAGHASPRMTARYTSRMDRLTFEVAKTTG